MPRSGTLITEIAQRLHEGRLILFAGAGLSRPYLPDWAGLLNDLRKLYFEEPGDLEGNNELTNLLRDKQYLAAAWAIDKKTSGAWRDHVQKAFQSPPKTPDERKNHEIAKAKYDALKGLPFAAVITTNYDSFLDSFFPHAGSPILHSDTEEVVELLKSPRLLKLHGDAAKRKSLILTHKDYRTLKHDCPELALTMEAAARLCSFLFVGYSMQDEDLMGWLEHVCHRTLGKGGHHYALINPKDWGHYRRQQYAELYDIHMVDAEPDAAGYPDIIRFFNDLRAAHQDLHLTATTTAIQNREAETPWDPNQARLYVDPLVKPGSQSLDAVFKNWLNDETSPFLVILGAFGTGKTWFSLRARDLASKHTSRQPRLIELGRFKAGAGPDDIAGALGGDFLQANTQGKLLLILDAFDEMGRRPGETLDQSFERLRPLTEGKAKVVLTCRTELFAGSAHEPDKIQAKGASKYEVQPFDKPRIQQALNLLGRGDAMAWIEADEALLDLASRPMFLGLILDWKRTDVRPTLNELYESAVMSVLSRGTDRIDPGRHAFARKLA